VLAVSTQINLSYRLSKSANPKKNATQIRLKLIEEGLMNADATSVASVQRFIKRNFVRDAQNPQCKDRKAFEEEFSNAMWQADTLFGPFVKTPGSNGVKRSYLQMILDDKSRMRVAGRFYKADNAVNFSSNAQSGSVHLRIPRKLYVTMAPLSHEAFSGGLRTNGCCLFILVRMCFQRQMNAFLNTARALLELP
jgi:hypothetical protein